MQKLNTFALTLLITGAIDSIRNLPTSALFGSSIFFFFIFSAIVFLIPTALISAELSANVKEGGIYQWCKIAFGEHVGFLAVWLQWINNIVWFPTILSFIAGTATYFFDPALGQNKLYLVSVVVSVFWLVTFMNLKGIRLSAKFTSFCAMVGLVIPMLFIIVLLSIWVLLGNPLQIHLNATNIIPNLNNTDNWIALTAIMTSFLGMELATVHIKDVKQPQKTFPRALVISTFLIITTMMLGSLAIAMVLPHSQINLVNGTMQTFSYYFSAYHLDWFTPILTCMLIIGSLGGMVSWIVSPIKGIHQAATHGFLSKKFTEQNESGVPKNLLILQAFLVSIVCFVFLLFPGVNASYWLLTSLSTQLYMLMYVLMFCCALKLRFSKNYKVIAFAIPGKKTGFILTCILGFIGCCITLAIGFIPPSNINVGGKLYYQFIFCSGMLVMIMPVFFFYWYKHKNIHLSPTVPLETEKVYEGSF